MQIVKFVELALSPSNTPLHINPDQVAALELVGECTVVVLRNDRRYDVMGTQRQVRDRLEEATYNDVAAEQVYPTPVEALDAKVLELGLTLVTGGNAVGYGQLDVTAKRIGDVARTIKQAFHG